MENKLKYLLILSLLCFGAEAIAKKFKYIPKSDPYAILEKSREKALKEDKLILVIFGSDWCPDCRSLAKKMNSRALKKDILQRYIVMHVDIGNWDKNIEFTKIFGDPIDGGIPSIAIMDKEKKLYYVSKAGEFASARGMTIESLTKWLVGLWGEIIKIKETEANKPLKNDAASGALSKELTLSVRGQVLPFALVCKSGASH